MIGRTLLALASVAAIALPAAAGSRLYRTENAWYAVADGRIAYSVFIADAADGTRSFGTDLDAEAVYARVKTTVPPSFKRLGVTLSEPIGCTDAPDKNGRSVSGWAFTCVFPVAPPSAPNSTTTVASSAPSTPTAAPALNTTPSAPAVATKVKVETAAASPSSPKAPVPAKPTPSAEAPVLASATPSPVQRPTVAKPAEPGDADLNARVKAELEAVDARNAARTAEFEAAKKATADAYAAQLAAYQAQVQATEQKRQADLEVWKGRVAACKAGDTAQCGQ